MSSNRIVSHCDIQGQSETRWVSSKTKSIDGARMSYPVCACDKLHFVSGCLAPGCKYANLILHAPQHTECLQSVACPKQPT